MLEPLVHGFDTAPLRWLRGVVTGDTHRGWTPASSPGFEGLGLTKVRDGQGQVLPDVGVRYSIEDEAASSRLVDLRDAELVVGLQRHHSFLDGVEAQGSAGIVLRNTEGQLLLAAVYGTFSEHAAELLPEIRLQKGDAVGDPIDTPCERSDGKPGVKRMRKVAVRIATQNSDAVLSLGAAVDDRLAVGCVEFLVCRQGAIELVNDGGCGGTDYLGLLLMRTSLLEN